MRKILITTAVLLAGLGLRADEPKSSYTITTDFVFVSEYVFRGFEQTDSAFQPAVTLTADSLSVGIWTSQAAANRSEGWAQGNEVDLWLTYGVPVGQSTLTFGGTAYLYPSARARLGEPDKTYEGSVALSGPLGPLTGTATYFHDFVLDANTVQFGLAHSIAMPDDKGSFDLSANYGFNKIDDGNGDLAGTGGVDYRYYLLTAALSYKLNDAATLKLSANYTGVNKVAGAPKNLWFSIGVSAGL